MINKIIELLRQRWSTFFPGTEFPANIKPLLANSYYCSILFLFRDNESFPFLHIKIVADKEHSEVCKKEYETVRLLKKADYYGMASGQYDIYYSGYIDNYYIQVRSFIHGISMQHLLFQKSEFSLNELLDVAHWISSMHRATIQQDVNYDFSLQSYEAFLRPCVTTFTQKYQLSAKELKYLDCFVAFSLAKTLPAFPIVVEHGDVNPGNIIVFKNKRTLIDWDRVKFEGFPLRDLINFLIGYSVNVRTVGTSTKSLSAALGGKLKATWATKEMLEDIFFTEGNQSETFRQIIHAYIVDIGIDERLIKYLFLSFAVCQPMFELFQLFCEKEDKFFLN